MTYSLLLAVILSSALGAASADVYWEPCFLLSTENNASLPMVLSMNSFPLILFLIELFLTIKLGAVFPPQLKNDAFLPMVWSMHSVPLIFFLMELFLSIKTAFRQISECANFSVPFNYSEPSGPSFPLFVKRTRSNGAQRALFLIPGGPGESGARTDELVPIFLPTTGLVSVPYDIYQIDHRGTGRSNRIFCANDSEDRSASCLSELLSNYSSTLPHMTATNAARDYQTVISWVRSNARQQIVLYAGSYGTYLASRLLTLDPLAADAIILDGVVSGSNKFAQADANLNVTAAIFGAACDADPTCSSRMGPNSFDTQFI
jgi:hypothetical protein